MPDFSFHYLTGGGHRKSDQDQRERPMGGWMQRQTRPLSFHPRSVVGTVLSRWRELRSAGSRHLQHIPSLSVSSCWNRRFLQAHTMKLWAKLVSVSCPPQHVMCWLILSNVFLMNPSHIKSSPCGRTDIGLPALWNITADTLKYMAACIGSPRMTLEGPLTVWRERPLFNPFEATKKQTGQELA